MDVIGKIVIKVVNFEMEGLFGSCLVCFVITFVWNYKSAWRDSKMFGTGCLRGMLTSSLGVLSWKCSEW